MEQYTTYCTEEQTKKALELGAPLEFIPMFRYGDNSLPKFVHKNKWNRDEFCYCPTAEQMIGWLEERRIFVHIDYNFSYDKPYKCEMCLFNGMTNHRGWFISRKEATLAAIDAALDYLINKKE